MNISKKPLLIGLIFISCFVFLFFISFVIEKNNLNDDQVFLEPNKEASLSEINFYDIENNQFFLESFKGKVLLINLSLTSKWLKKHCLKFSFSINLFVGYLFNIIL